MVRIWLIGTALMLTIAIPAAAQQRTASAPEVLGRLHGLCEQDYKPACIKLGLVIGRLPPFVARSTQNGGGGSAGSFYSDYSIARAANLATN